MGFIAAPFLALSACREVASTVPHLAVDRKSGTNSQRPKLNISDTLLNIYRCYHTFTIHPPYISWKCEDVILEPDILHKIVQLQVGTMKIGATFSVLCETPESLPLQIHPLFGLN